MTRRRWHPMPRGTPGCRAPDSFREDCVAQGQTAFLREPSSTTRSGGPPRRDRRPDENAPASADQTPSSDRAAAILRQGGDIGPASGAARAALAGTA
jgi:hypothetical protein